MPNPSRRGTTLRFSLPHEGRARLTVFDSRGRRVVSLVDAVRATGEHSITWNGRDEKGSFITSGLYFARLEFEGDGRTRRIVLLK